MDKLQRYRFDSNPAHPFTDYHEPDEQGDWCQSDDVEKLEARVKELEWAFDVIIAGALCIPKDNE